METYGAQMGQRGSAPQTKQNPACVHSKIMAAGIPTKRVPKAMMPATSSVFVMTDPPSGGVGTNRTPADGVCQAPT